MERFRVVICGAGIAGVEGLLRLRRLAGDRVDITLVSPRTYLDYRPLAVLEPFSGAQVRRFPVARIAGDAGARWIQESLGWVDRTAQTAVTSTGQSIRYDALLLAPGGRLCPTSPFMDAFTSGPGASAYAEIVAGVDDGRLTDLAFVVPEGPSWPLPLYELALLTAKRAADRSRTVHLDFVTPANAPLAIFGKDVSAAVARLLSAAHIRVHSATHATMPARRCLLLGSSGVELHPQRTITLQRISGPDVPGIPGDARHRFLEVDQHCVVRAAGGRIFAAGDATSLPVKHGALGAQQADTAAAGIAHLAGCGPPSSPLYPVLRCAVFTGAEPLYLTADLIAGQGWNARIDVDPPWDAAHKVVAAELGPYLDQLSAEQ
jgi:sulfide:quinone oxidoreductase